LVLVVQVVRTMTVIMVPIQSSAVLHQLVAVAVRIGVMLVLLVVLVAVAAVTARTLVVLVLAYKALLVELVLQVQVLAVVVRVPWVLMPLLLAELEVLE
tara:strand:+ start:616 stop:912 length:297 start_codon:yes stop_codon:yes gene_type:complete